MDCKEFREVLDLYIDRELSPDALTAAHIHLNECRGCRRAQTELLRLKEALKLTASRHQPPQDLVSYVHNITQPRWRKLLGIRSRKADSVTPPAHPLWRENIRLPVPVFALLLISVITLGILFLRARSLRPGEPFPDRTIAIRPAGKEPSIEAIDFSRFDHGESAHLYKAPR